MLLVGPTVSQGTAQTSDSVCGGLVEAQCFSFQACHKAGRLIHGQNSAPVSVHKDFLRRSLQITERGGSPIPHPYFKQH